MNGYIFEMDGENPICVDYQGRKIIEITILKEEEKEESWKE